MGTYLVISCRRTFYLGLALLVFVFIKLKVLTKAIIPMCLSCFIICLFLRFYNISNHGYGHYSHLFPTHLRVDSLLFGTLLSYLHCFKKNVFEKLFSQKRTLKYTLSLLSISIAFVFKIESFFINTIGLTLLYLSFGTILGLFLTDKNIGRKLDTILSNRLTNLISKIGVYSYGIYLFHLIAVSYFFIAMNYYDINFNPTIRFITYIFISIFSGIFMSKIVEQPLLKYRDRITTKS